MGTDKRSADMEEAISGALGMKGHKTEDDSSSTTSGSRVASNPVPESE